MWRCVWGCVCVFWFNFAVLMVFFFFFWHPFNLLLLQYLAEGPNGMHE